VTDQSDATGPDQPFGAISFGKVFTNPPVPHVPGNTLMFEAGPITIGVEYRLLNEEIPWSFGRSRTAPPLTRTTIRHRRRVAGPLGDRR
jgi:hypothetical protein